MHTVFSLSLPNKLSVLSGSPLYAVDRDIGQVRSVKQGSIEEKAVQAVETAYDNKWMEQYVDSSLYYGFAHSFSQTLIHTLPLVAPLIVSTQQLSNQEVLVKLKDRNDTLVFVTFDSVDPQVAHIVTIDVTRLQKSEEK